MTSAFGAVVVCGHFEESANPLTSSDLTLLRPSEQSSVKNLLGIDECSENQISNPPARCHLAVVKMRAPLAQEEC